MQAWIASCGIIKQVAVAAPLNLPSPQAPSDGKSEVGASKEKLPSPQQFMSKVQQSDDVKHILNKGVWAATLAMHQGWKIFVDVSSFLL